jgi:hypothetical protein
MRSTSPGMARSDSEAAARSDSGMSPAWGRRGVGDDNWAPVVVGCGARSSKAGWRGFLGRLVGPMRAGTRAGASVADAAAAGLCGPAKLHGWLARLLGRGGCCTGLSLLG